MMDKELFRIFRFWNRQHKSGPRYQVGEKRHHMYVDKSVRFMAKQEEKRATKQ